MGYHRLAFSGCQNLKFRLDIGMSPHEVKFDNQSGNDVAKHPRADSRC